VTDAFRAAEEGARAGQVLSDILGAQREDVWSGTSYPEWTEQSASLATFIGQQQHTINQLREALAAAQAAPVAPPVPVVAPVADPVVVRIRALAAEWEQWATDAQPGLKMFHGKVVQLLNEGGTA
jgi:nucleotide-binding universal stress UspA family protein